MGVIGCGAISGAYLGMASNFPVVEVAAVADVVMENAHRKAKEFNIPRVMTVDELLADPSIELVLNLTVPKAHLPIAMRSLEAGKHTYAEKPLGIDFAEGQRVVEFGRQKGLLVGCAPDTFMGAGIQTARQLIDEKIIGEPVAATAFMCGKGHEHWHANPEFYYEVGGGPMFDMGPYYLTALLNLFGPVKRLMGMARISRAERTILHKDAQGKPMHKYGKVIPVQTPDHVTGTLEFANGCICTIIQSFAMAHSQLGGTQPIEIYGTKGTMRVPDPNGFEGVISVRGWDETEWRDMPLTFVKGYGRSVGAADMAVAIRTGRNFRANGQQALAVLELMQGFLDSSRTSRAIVPSVHYERPAAMNPNLPFGQLD
ncbi:MAG: Gfo/Idh/MocA family oxidoreductase [Phycisphaerales bacterium]|nr:Gfo/Idh/MocA family oxidoreductase [Phycisphaerales bacterium]